VLLLLLSKATPIRGSTSKLSHHPLPLGTPWLSLLLATRPLLLLLCQYLYVLWRQLALEILGRIQPNASLLQEPELLSVLLVLLDVDLVQVDYRRQRQENNEEGLKTPCIDQECRLLVGLVK
jgi:hypothetical protein